MKPKSDQLIGSRSSRQELDQFLRQLKQTPATTRSGKLLFGLDATASRQATWDLACHLQADMFLAAQSVGRLAVQLCYYRGFREFHVTDWHSDAQAMIAHMSAVSCHAGHTQLERLLEHSVVQAQRHNISALVFVGDCTEEDIDRVCHSAGKLALHGVPAFMFQEGDDPAASQTFQEIARLTRGAHCHFDAGSAQQLTELLIAVANYAVGGTAALKELQLTNNQARRLLQNLGAS